MPVADHAAPWAAGGVDSSYAWARLGLAVLLNTLGGVGLWSIVVALPAVQAEFGTARAAAALPYTLTTIGFAAGGVLMGRLADRFGVMWPVLGGSLSLGLGYLLAAQAGDITSFALIHGVFIGLFGACAMFGPLVADTSLWFRQRRGLAVAICACGNYFAGTVWPPLLQWGIAELGWRRTHELVGLVCLAVLLPLALLLRRRAPRQETVARAGGSGGTALGLSPGVLQGVIVAAGIACCVAMAMPQVHIVAYCVDLGYGAARGAEMLSLMLATGVVSRLVFGLVMDRIGALPTLVLASLLQAVALALFLPFDELVPLYVISGLFGLFQGGIVPCYAVIVRENFPASEVGVRVSLALSATLVGMALGGWMSGFVFDMTGSYRMAVVNGLLWNGAHLLLAGWLLWRGRARRVAFA
ncbi:MFS transporter [Siccirubricoccus phaeus]|uniref:MFS transporter n=1 Tax=Siccirubricoccus phaeus TaxID=2595053 RepID=UPI0011F3F9B4|nr:MFS transporter [Siccirubricoccus phaeus]